MVGEVVLLDQNPAEGAEEEVVEGAYFACLAVVRSMFFFDIQVECISSACNAIIMGKAALVLRFVVVVGHRQLSHSQATFGKPR